MENYPLTIESPPPEYAMRVHGEDSRPLVTLKTDGTIIVHEMGADVEAATRFWDAIRFEGRTLREERDTARRELCEQAAENKRRMAGVIAWRGRDEADVRGWSELYEKEKSDEQNT